MAIEKLDPFTEELAGYAHQAWSGWMTYLFSKCTMNTDGSVTIPLEFVNRWLRQSSLSYYELPESEKESDRDEARKMIVIIDSYHHFE